MARKPVQNLLILVKSNKLCLNKGQNVVSTINQRVSGLIGFISKILLYNKENDRCCIPSYYHRLSVWGLNSVLYSKRHNNLSRKPWYRIEASQPANHINAAKLDLSNFSLIIVVCIFMFIALNLVEVGNRWQYLSNECSYRP